MWQKDVILILKEQLLLVKNNIKDILKQLNHFRKSQMNKYSCKFLVEFSVKFNSNIIIKKKIMNE